MSEEKKKLTRDEAEEIIRDWADYFEADNEDTNDAIKTLSGAVMNERLSFDKETKKFRLKLFEPIEFENLPKIEIVEFQALNLSDMKVVQRYKDSESIDRTTAMLARSSGLPIGSASRMHSKDVAVFNEINTIFLM